MNRVLNFAVVTASAFVMASAKVDAAVINITEGSTTGYTMTDGNTYVIQDSVTFSNTTAGYDVPFNGGKRMPIAYNRNYKPHLAMSMEEIYRAFVGRCSIAVAAMLKLLETLRSYEYTEPVAGLCCWSWLE